jgi:hypothetical protein
MLSACLYTELPTVAAGVDNTIFELTTCVLIHAFTKLSPYISTLLVINVGYTFALRALMITHD